MPRRVWSALGALVLLLSGAAPAAAQQAPSAPGAGAWAPGPAAAGDRNTLAGVIDTPGAGASLTGPSVQLGGWFVDLTAQGWTGADDVEVFLGSMDGGGRPLAHAQLQQTRADVANALKNPYWAQSGWSANVPLAGVPAGQNALSVYVHTPSRGWWTRQVSVTIRTPATTPTPALQAFGNDISHPQCPSGAEPPPPAFAIVGVNGGRPFTTNPCLPREFTWALGSTSPNQAHVGFYLNTANPGPNASPHWPAAGTTSPRACDGSWNADCAYDYGWLSAQDAFARAAGVAGQSAAVQNPWWLDVEASNSWSDDTASNAADIQGAVAYLHSLNVNSIGIYSTSTDWDALIGSAAATAAGLSSLPNWRPGAANLQEAPSWCSRTVTGGRVKFVQFPNAGFDADFACF